MATDENENNPYPSELLDKSAQRLLNIIKTPTRSHKGEISRFEYNIIDPPKMFSGKRKNLVDELRN
jgi:hypothetical protein